MRSITYTLRDTKLTFWVLITLLIFVFAVYLVSIKQTVSNVAERQHLEEEMYLISSKIADLEFQSIALKNNITTDSAMEMGFNFTDKAKYVSRTSSVALLSYTQNSR